jgi:ABC-type antimicrobial peptide transport system permease subunit
LASLLFSGLAFLALVVVTIGIYGALAYRTGQRIREIGIRRALGASGHQVLTLVVADGLRPVAAGIAIGTVAAFVGARSLTALLYGVSPADPFTFLAVGVTIAIAAVMACVLPAIRGLRVDPKIALTLE